MMSYPHNNMHFNGNAHCGKDREKDPVYCGQPYTWTCIRLQSVTNIHNMPTIILHVHRCCILVYAVLLYVRTSYSMGW